MDKNYIERFSRQMALAQFGAESQEKLLNARVCIVGLGGLGSPVSLYLATAGIGELVLVDPDTVSLSNLQRQILHGEEDLGAPKTLSAEHTLNSLNSGCRIHTFAEAFSEKNRDKILHGCTLVIDATDNYATRSLISDATMEKNIPMVYGAIQEYCGQIGIFSPRNGTPCYRCFLGEQSPLTASPTGIPTLGPLPGVIGSMQALEAIKFIVGIASPLLGSLLHIDTLTLQFTRIPLPACEHTTAH